jgi:hypothetical protein
VGRTGGVWENAAHGAKRSESKSSALKIRFIIVDSLILISDYAGRLSQIRVSPAAGHILTPL